MIIDAFYDLKTRYRLRYGNCVFLFQMGKVGSKTIHSSLKESCYTPMHFHDINYNISYSEVRTIWRSIRSKRIRPKIITLVRDPFERNISSFFESFSRFNPYLSDKIDNYTVSELIEIFLTYFPHRYPLDWLDYNIRCLVGIDVYKYPLREGTITISEDRADILLIKSELPNERKITALNGFLPNLNLSHLENKNIGMSKDYAAIYNAFKAEIRFPSDLISEIKASKYYQKFYA